MGVGGPEEEEEEKDCMGGILLIGKDLMQIEVFIFLSRLLKIPRYGIELPA